MQNYNWVDFAIFGVFFLSILAGLVRGFIKEIISVGSWIAAVIVATMFSTKLAAMFGGTGTAEVQNTMGAGAAQALSMASIAISFVVLFLGTLLIGSLIGYSLSSIATGTGLGLIDRLLGGVFGGVRGYIITVVLIFLAQLTPIMTQPFWSQSQLVPTFQPAVQWLSDWISPEVRAVQQQAAKIFQNVSSQLPSASGLLQGIRK